MKDCFDIIKDHTEFAELFASSRGDNAKMREVASKALENLHGDLNKLKATLGKPVQPYKPVDRTADIESKKAEYQNKIDELSTPKGNTSNVVIDEPNKSGESIPLKEADEKQATEIPNPKEEGSTTIPTDGESIPKTEAGEGGSKEPPKGEEPVGEGEGMEEFDKMMSELPNDTGDMKKYLSGKTINKFTDRETENDQTYREDKLLESAQHGQDLIGKAKEVFGDKYVEKTLEYLEAKNVPTDVKAVALVSLENAMELAVSADPKNLGLHKLQDLVRAKSQAFLHKAAIAINAGRFRKLKELNFDLTKFTDDFFTAKQKEDKRTVEKSIEADAETIQKQYEDNVQESAAPDMALEAKIKEGVDAEIAKLYEALPKEKKTAVDKAIAALDKVHEKLRGKAYESTLGIPIAIIDMGVVTIRAALKAGVQAAKAVEMGIEKIKEKYGKEWGNENVFRKDYLDGLKEQGVLDAQQRRQAEKEYRMLETERNRQLARVSDLTEKLKTLQGGERPATNTKEAKPDVPEIEALKQKVKEETQKLNSLDAQQKRIDGLETELERLQQRLPKEKSESVKREISEKEQELKGKIEAEKEIIRKENKENNQLRLSDAKNAVRQRIEKIKTEIANKERELKEKNKPLNEDLELARLREIEKQITELRDKYLPEEKDPYEAEKQRERVKDKLVADIITLNEQINAGERNKATDKPSYENDAEINKLKKIREDKRAILNEIDPLAAPKEKTTAERKADAESNLQKRIDAIREEILSGERDLKQSKDKLQGKKLDQLREQKKSLEALRDKYLPKDKDPYADKKAAKAVEDKLVKENIELNRQIAKGEKDIKEGKESSESAIIDKLKAERDGRKEILEALDPSPKIFTENALIKKGFGKKVNVKTKNGVIEKEALDWTKLAGEEGSVDNISKHVGDVLKESGYTEEQGNRMADAFIKEYNDLRTSVIEKGLSEIARRNQTSVTPEQKSAAKRLSELYNYGLFEKKNFDEFEIVLNKALGVSKLTGERIKRVEDIAKAMSTALSSKYQGKKLEQYQIQAAEQHIQELVRDEITDELSIASIRSDGKIDRSKVFYKITDLAGSYMDMAQMMALNTVKNAVLENPISGYMEAVFNKVGNKDAATKEIRGNASKIGGKILKEMVSEKGSPFGDVTSTFVTRGNIERELNKVTDKKAYQTALSTLTGKTLLSGMDSYYKSINTERNFLTNVQKILTQDRKIGGEIVKGMTKDEARNYIAERLSKQNYAEAEKTAKEIIEKVNKDAGRKIFNDSENFVARLANDIVKGSLVTGGKITSDMVTGSYEAAYDAAGRGLGHVANNIASRMIGTETGRIENKIKQLIKEKDYQNAAYYRMYGMLFKNILNPYVGGGTNWVVLQLERGGAGLVTGLGSMIKDRNARKLDLTTDAGLKDMKNALYANMKIRDKFIRGAVGGSVGLVTALIWGQIRDKDDYEKWRKKNGWATKYTDILYPQVGQYFDASKRGELPKQVEKNMNLSEQFDKGKMAWDAFNYVVKGENEKALGKVGQLNPFGAPLPWRMVRDIDQIVVGATGGEPYRVPSGNPEGFWEGYWRGGMKEYITIRKNGMPENTQEFTPDELKSESFKILTDNQVKLPEVPDNKKNMVIEDDTHPEGKMTEEEYKTFTEEWKKEVKKGVDELYNKGRIKTTTKIDKGGNVVSESNPSKVSMSDLDKDNLEKELSSIKSEATEIAKKKAVKQSKTITTYEKRD